MGRTIWWEKWFEVEKFGGEDVWWDLECWRECICGKGSFDGQDGLVGRMVCRGEWFGEGMVLWEGGLSGEKGGLVGRMDWRGGWFGGRMVW